MRKWILFGCAAALMLCFAACSARLSLAETGIVQIAIVSQPESGDYARSYTDPEKTRAVAAYLNSLSLERNFPENPDEYVGMAYVITIRYASGEEREFCHFGNMFLQETGGEWMRMNYQEAARLDDLIRSTPSG